MVTCRCGCEFENDRWTPGVTCPKCGRSYPNEAPDMFHPKTWEELRWTCPKCGTVNEYGDGVCLRGSCAKCGAAKPGSGVNAKKTASRSSPPERSVCEASSETRSRGRNSGGILRPEFFRNYKNHQPAGAKAVSRDEPQRPRVKAGPPKVRAMRNETSSDMCLTVMRLCGPSHAAEPDFGYTLERHGGRWYWVVTGEFAGSGGTTRNRTEYLLPEDFFEGLNWDNFAGRLIDSVSPYPYLSRKEDFSKCPDAKRIERLFR